MNRSTQITLTKNIGKFGEKDRKPSPTLSKWEYCCQNWQIIPQFWQKYSHFEKIGDNFLYFFHVFLTIFVSVGGMHEYQSVPKMNIFLLMGGGGPQNNNPLILLLHLQNVIKNVIKQHEVMLIIKHFFSYFQGRGGGSTEIRNMFFDNWILHGPL